LKELANCGPLLLDKYAIWPNIVHQNRGLTRKRSYRKRIPQLVQRITWRTMPTKPLMPLVIVISWIETMGF
jgi:hypothetical protein